MDKAKIERRATEFLHAFLCQEFSLFIPGMALELKGPGDGGENLVTDFYLRRSACGATQFMFDKICLSVDAFLTEVTGNPDHLALQGIYADPGPRTITLFVTLRYSYEHPNGGYNGCRIRLAFEMNRDFQFIETNRRSI